MKLQDGWSRAVPVFDDERLVSCAGLVPVMGLAEQTGLAELIARAGACSRTRKVASAGVNPAGKLTSIIAGMAAGADCIDDLDLLRSGGMGRLFGGVYAPATLGQHLREFTHGHTLQLGSVLRAHLVNLVAATGLLPGISQRVFVDIDSLLRPTFGHAKQGASYGHTKIAGKQVLRKGLSPLATTLSTPTGAPVIAGIRLRAGRAGSGKGAASMVTDAIKVARAAGAAGEVLVRGDSAYGHSAVVRACLARRCPVLGGPGQELRGDQGDRRHPRRRLDPGPLSRRGARSGDRRVDLRRRGRRDTGVHRVRLHPHPVTARLIVRRVRDRATTRRNCSRSGGTTRSSPTALEPAPRPTSPTAGTRSSRPCSPT